MLYKTLPNVATLETTKKLGQVSFRKEFWDSYWERATV